MKKTVVAAFGLLALLTAAVYFPGLSGGFVFDDLANIVENPSLEIEDLSWDNLWSASVSGTAGPLKRPLAMFTFALNRYFNGLNPFLYKLTNVAVHVTVGLLLVCLMRMLQRSLDTKSSARAEWLIALSAGGLWLVHPLNLTSVLYVVQRMTSLAALFTVVGLIAYVYGRVYVRGAWRGLTVSLGGLTIAAIFACLCKETGALVFIYALVIEFTLLRFAGLDTRHAITPRQVFLGFMAAGALLSAVALWYTWDRLTIGYTTREFSLTERLLTEGRVVLFYLKQIFVPSTAELSLFHDDIALSRSLTSPISTLAALVSIVTFLGLAFWKRRTWPLLSFAILWFFAGHLLESTFLPLELVHEHRNYLPMVGPLFALTFFAVRGSVSQTQGNLIRYALVVYGVLLAGQTFVRAIQWSDPVTHAAYEAAHHPESFRANYAVGRILVVYNSEQDPDAYEQALDYFRRAMDIAPHRNKAIYAAIQTYHLRGETPPAELHDELLNRLRTYPYPKSELNDLRALISCREKGVCKISHADLDAIFEASVSNRWIRSYPKAVLWNLRARYAVQVMRDLQSAESYLHNALALQPNDTVFRSNLADIYMATGRAAAAERELMKAYESDPLRLYRDRLDRMSTQLGSLKKRLEERT